VVTVAAVASALASRPETVLVEVSVKETVPAREPTADGATVKTRLPEVSAGSSESVLTERPAAVAVAVAVRLSW
jgi:hypothetical protein